MKMRKNLTIVSFALTLAMAGTAWADIISDAPYIEGAVAVSETPDAVISNLPEAVFTAPVDPASTVVSETGPAAEICAPTAAAQQDAATAGPGSMIMSSGSNVIYSAPSANGNSAQAVMTPQTNVRLNLPYTLVSPAVTKSDIRVAEGSVQLTDGSWAAIGQDKNIRYPYYKLIREATDSTGTGWYIVNAYAKHIGDYWTADGSYARELWLKKSDCVAGAFIDIDTTSVKRQQIVSTALDLLGKQYVYGGSGPESFDCSGFVNYVFKQCGLSVPRTSNELCNMSGQISESQLRAGDIVGRSGHVGIYIGGGNFVHSAESSTGVVVENLDIYNRTNRFTHFVNAVGD